MPAGRMCAWIARYGPAEVLGTAGAVGSALGAHALGANQVAIAYAGAVVGKLIADLAFYAPVVLSHEIRTRFRR